MIIYENIGKIDDIKPLNKSTKSMIMIFVARINEMNDKTKIVYFLKLNPILVKLKN